MTRPRARRTCRLGAAALAASAFAAYADDAAKDAPPADKPTLTGDVRVGMRFLSGEGEGRFQQDVGLSDGPRIFDMNLLALDPREGASIDELEARMSGVGDRDTDYLLSLRKRGLFDLSGGYRRDDVDYRATGDPFPYDTLRERGFVHGRWTPNGDFALRFNWDHDERRGHAATYGENPNSATVSEFEPRAISFSSDRFSLGGDYAVSIFRFGLTQTIGVATTSDARAVDAQNTTDVGTRSNTYATTGKAGVVLLDGTLDATFFLTKTRLPLDERMNGTQSKPTGGVEPISDATRIQRDAMDWRFESSWRPMKAWEFTIAGESDEIVDVASGTYLENGAPDSLRSASGRVVDHEQRWSADATWDATDKVRLRAGEQYLRETLFVPFDSPFTSTSEVRHGPYEPTDLASTAWRTTAGADWNPTKAWSLSALAHISTNDHPQTTAVAENATDWTARAKWRPAEATTFTTVWRRQWSDHESTKAIEDFGKKPQPFEPQTPDTILQSFGKSDSISQSGAWTHGPWTVTGTATYQEFDTSSDSHYGYQDLSYNVFDRVGFSDRSAIANLDVRYEALKTLRFIGDVAYTIARGETKSRITGTSSANSPFDGVTTERFDSRWLSASLGAEYDLRKDVTLGLTVSTWRLIDQQAPADGYRVYGAEVSLTYRF